MRRRFPCPAFLMKFPQARRVAGVPVLALIVVGAVLFALRSIPPRLGRSPQRAAAPETAQAPMPGSETPSPLPDRLAASSKPAATRSTEAIRADVGAVMGSQEGDARLEALSPLLAEWLAVDAGAAAAWASALPAGTFRTDAVTELLVQWADLDPAAAGAWLASSPLLDAETASTLAGRWGARDAKAAAAWAATLQNGAERSAARAAVAAAWASAEPAVAATWAESLPDADRPAAAVAVADAWARTAPALAAAWVARLSRETSAAAIPAAGIVAMHWTEQDPGAVSRWLNALPDGQQKDAAATLFALGVAPVAPQDALLWAGSLTEPTARAETVAGVCERWYDANPEEFKSGIPAQLDLMEEPALRHAVYAMLYEKDPEFRLTLLKIADGEIPPPGAAEPGAPPDAQATPR